MKKNYLSKTAMSANPLVETIAKKLSKNTTTTWLLLLFSVLLFSLNSWGQTYTVPRTGNNAITTCSGIIRDSGGTGDYQNSSNGYTVINPSVAGNYVRVSGSGNTESNYDFLYVYDGVGTGGPILWSWTNNGTGAFTIPTITSVSGSLTIRFTSDVSVVRSGFEMNISCSATAGSPSYCTPTSWDSDGLYIDNLGFIGTLSDPPANASTFSANGYQDFTSLSPLAIQAQGEGVNITAHATGNVHLRGTWKAWVDWNKNGTFEPATEEVYNIQGFAGADATFGFVIPPTTPPGDYRIRIRVNNGTDWLGETYGFDFSPCDDFENGFWEDNYGETEDYLFTVVTKCNSLITTITNGSRCGAGTVTLGATATAGVTEFRWYTVATGGSYVTSTVTGTSTSFTPTIAATTNYYVTALNGSCESQVRTLVVAKVSPIPVVSFTPASPVICGENSIISLTATGDTEITHLINENFEGAGLGVFSNINNDTNGAVVDAITSWKNQTSTYVPTTTNVWFPAVSSGFGTNKFALAYSDSDPSPTNTIENSIALTTAVNSNTFLNLTLKLKLYYSRYFPDGYINPLSDEYVSIELSTNGGTTYPIVLQTFTSDVGIGTRFAELSYDLSAYINQPNLKIRVRHRSYAGTGWLPDGVAIDDVELFGTKPLNTAFNYDTATVDAFTNPGATIPYVSGAPATTIYIKPTLTQLENASFNIPVSATLSNGCSATGSITVTNNTKMFVAGTIGTDWNTGTNWKPNGVPTANNCVVIFDNDVNITGTNYTGYGLNLTVKPTGNLNVAPTNTALITDFVNVEAGGIFEVEDDASLVQVNNVANTVAGTFNSRRIAVTNNTLDYVYWSTPVAGFSVNNVTPSSTYRYAWNPTVNNGGTYLGNFGNWVGASGAMTTGRGYIIRGSSGNTTFTGVPNNGNITIPITRGTYTSLTNYTGPTATPVTRDDDNWNLLGNPYPSALSADAFLTANLANLAPSVKIWTHGIDPAAIADPFYQDYQLNYNTSDYITYNRLGGTQAGFDGYIGSGQGFFVLMNDAGATTENAVFNNTMRSNAFRNDQFYRAGEDFERHRIWLKIISPTNTTNDMLVGYTTEATNGFDSIFDTQNVGVKTNFEIYSLIENSGYIIQGRGLPFDNNDQIPLGVSVPQNGIYVIAIDAVDGLFTNTTQNIYLEDTTLGITHDLRAAPYSFTANVGRFDNRFVLKFKNETLGNEDFTANTVMVYANDNINVVANNQTIKSVRVYDLLGRVLGTFNNVDATAFSTKNVAKTQSPLLVEVTLSNGTVVSKKTIY